MKKSVIIVSAIACALFVAVPLLARQNEMPTAVPPAKQHQWLKQFVGEWDVTSEMRFAPDAPPIEGAASESVHALGELWIVTDLNGEMPGGAGRMRASMTIGFDPEKGQFVGTWIDSFHPILWQYTGFLDDTGKILTLEAQGPNMLAPGTTAKYRDVIEFRSKDQRILTSSMQGPDGEWVSFMTATYTRKK